MWDKLWRCTGCSMVVISVFMPQTKKILPVLIFLLSVFHGADGYAASLIRSIQFEGNEVTQEIFLRRTIFLSEGDVLDDARLAESLQTLMDTGLFKKVDYYVSSDISEAENTADSQVDLVIQVKEKHYLLVVPRLRVKDNETHVGIQLRWDNLFGFNHRLRYLVEDRGTTAGIDEQRNQFDYFFPNIRGSRYSLSFRLVD
ncbi:MAG: translocation and assembly module TamA, partial [Pseudomonadota bacterium]|nr:translocation and assembly module TamA [Pseudomonadota bacterium]